MDRLCYRVVTLSLMLLDKEKHPWFMLKYSDWTCFFLSPSIKDTVHGFHSLRFYIIFFSSFPVFVSNTSLSSTCGIAGFYSTHRQLSLPSPLNFSFNIVFFFLRQVSGWCDCEFTTKASVINLLLKPFGASLSDYTSCYAFELITKQLFVLLNVLLFCLATKHICFLLLQLWRKNEI